jgi:DnaJ-class molecular chaperone
MICDACDGDGLLPELEPCPHCGATGIVPRPLDEREDRLGVEHDR